MVNVGNSEWLGDDLGASCPESNVPDSQLGLRLTPWGLTAD